MESGLTRAKDCSEKWGLTIKYVQTLCRQGLIDGAVKINGRWYIPCDAEKPKDNRVVSGKYVNWRKRYNVDGKIDAELQQMIDEVHENAERHDREVRLKKEVKLKF